MKRLDACVDCRLALVVAPAASGKTTWLRRWARDRPWPIAWVTLEPADNLPRQFMTDLIAALSPISIKIETVQMDSLREINIAETIVDLIDAVAEIREDWALVLDSYELIVTPEIQAGVRLLLDYMPPAMHIIIASRTEPPLQLSRLRVRRQLIEIGPRDLSVRRPDRPGSSP